MVEIIKDDRMGELQPGNYFIRTKTDKKYKGSLYKGALVLLTDVDIAEDEVSYSVINPSPKPGYDVMQSFTSGIGEFLSQNRFEPEGRAIRDQQLREAMMAAKGIASEITEESEQLQSLDQAFKPKALVGLDVDAEPQVVEPGGAGDELAAGASTALVRQSVDGATRVERAEEIIGTIADRRNRISEKKLALDAAKKNVEALLKEQKIYMQALTGFMDVVEKVEDVISRLNLYLGNGEEIVQLRNGKPADKSVPLTVRQLVLFMDEECALATESGGIDAYKIEEFDEWLLEDPKHLDQVLPEVKGVVCLKPRRSMKEYSEDAQVNARLNEANRETYILIRNGDNLFRVCPPWEVRQHFFPTKNEFTDRFMKETTEYRHGDVGDEKKKKNHLEAGWTEEEWNKGRRRVIEPMSPGSFEHRDEAKNVDKDMDYYARALIMLQGLVDRTGIFPEYQEAGLNLMDVTQWTDHLRFVHDADPAFLLTSGRETFDEFLVRVNSDLQIGDRIIGMFHQLIQDTQREKNRWDKVPTRITPQSASWPDDLAMYTIDGRSQGVGWKISYDRTDKIYRASWDKCGCDQQGTRHECTPKTKAVCQIKPDDELILAFDKVTLEEADYFLTDRLSRHDYIRMFELLKRVRNMKREEREQEAPFITLAIGEVMKIYPELTEPEIRPQVIEAVRWWKYKNKVHRAIVDDFAKALKAVVNQWVAMYMTDSVVDQNQSVIDHFKTDKTLAIFIRKTYVTVVERVSADKIFVAKRDYYRTKSGFTMYGEKTHTTVGSWYAGWEKIYESPEWESWPKGARSHRDFLTPAEYAWLFRATFSKINEELPQAVAAREGDGKWVNNKYVSTPGKLVSSDLVAVSLSVEKTIRFHYQIVVKVGGNKNRVRASKTVHWNRKQGGVAIEPFSCKWPSSSRGHDGTLLNAKPKIWDPEKDEVFYTYLDLEKVKAWKKMDSTNEAKARERQNLQSDGRAVFHRILVGAGRLSEELAKKKYLDNFGDPLNWDSFKGNKKRAGIQEWDGDDFPTIRNAMQVLFGNKEMDMDWVLDKTSGEILDRAVELSSSIEGTDVMKLREAFDEGFVPFPVKGEDPEVEVEEEYDEEEEAGMEWEHPE